MSTESDGLDELRDRIITAATTLLPDCAKMDELLAEVDPWSFRFESIQAVVTAAQNGTLRGALDTRIERARFIRRTRAKLTDDELTALGLRPCAPIVEDPTVRATPTNLEPAPGTPPGVRRIFKWLHNERER